MWLAHFRRHMRDRLIDFCKQKFGTRQEVLVADLDTPRASFGLLIAHEVLRDKGGLFLRSSIIWPLAAVAVRDQAVSGLENEMVLGHLDVSPFLNIEDPKLQTAGSRKKFPRLKCPSMIPAPTSLRSQGSHPTALAPCQHGTPSLTGSWGTMARLSTICNGSRAILSLGQLRNT